MSGTYTVTVTLSGCTKTATTAVIIAPSYNINKNAAICPGATYTLPSGTIINAAGVYTDSLTAFTGCDSVIITTVSISIPGADAGQDTSIIRGNTTQLNASGGGTYSWTPSTGLSCNNCSNPVASPTVTTTYVLTITNTDGCSATDTIIITVKEPCNDKVDINTLIPNAFSPNNDGWNDLLCIPANLCISKLSLKIYDRWGEEVYNSDDLTKCWNGTYKGKELNTAVFVYYLSVEMESGEIKNGKGNITLLK